MFQQVVNSVIQQDILDRLRPAFLIDGMGKGDFSKVPGILHRMVEI